MKFISVKDKFFNLSRFDGVIFKNYGKNFMVKLLRDSNETQIYRLELPNDHIAKELKESVLVSWDYFLSNDSFFEIAAKDSFHEGCKREFVRDKENNFYIIFHVFHALDDLGFKYGMDDLETLKRIDEIPRKIKVK